jgi:hypothetical protein
MGIWVAAVIVGLIGAGILIRRTPSTKSINAGQVSDGWLREQRAENHDRSI